MNRRMIVYILGWMLIAEAILMMPSLVVGVIYHEPAHRYATRP